MLSFPKSKTIFTVCHDAADNVVIVVFYADEYAFSVGVIIAISVAVIDNL